MGRCKAGKAAGRSAEATRINRLLDDINASLNTIYHELQRRDNYVTAEKVKNEFLGHSENHDTILNLFQRYNDDVKQLVGISKTIATRRKYGWFPNGWNRVYRLKRETAKYIKRLMLNNNSKTDS